MKLKFKKPKSQLDEMQEQNLRSVEKAAFWIAYIGLTIAFTVQFAMGAEPIQVLDCWILLMVLSIFVWCRCYKYGIWARYMVPSSKTNLLASGIASLAIGITLYGTCMHFEWPTGEALKFSLISAAGGFVFIYVLGFISLKLYKKRRDKLDTE